MGAVTLHSHGGGVLSVKEGCVWATLEGPHQGRANDWRDRVLHGGERLQLLPGEHVVLEVFGVAANEAAYLWWEPVAAWQPPQAGVLAQAFAWLSHGSTWLLPGRGRVLAGLEANQP